MVPNAVSGNDVVKAPLSGVPDGGAATVLLSGIHAYSFAMDGASLYWTDFGDSTLKKAPISGLADGGAPIVLGPAGNSTNNIAIDGTYVYWSNSSSGEILKAQKSEARA